MKPARAVLVDSAIWAAWGTAVGAVAGRMPVERFEHDTALTRMRRWERDGRVWERVGVRRWKDRLPELGALFGGRTKRQLPGPGHGGLARFAAETRRAEYVHWLAPLPILAFPLWNPAWLTGVMAGYAVAANGPCLVVQRFNRGRVLRITSR